MVREQFLRDAPGSSGLRIAHSNEDRGRVSQPDPHQYANDVRPVLRLRVSKYDLQLESLFTTNVMNVGRFGSRSSAGSCRLWRGMRMLDWVDEKMWGGVWITENKGRRHDKSPS